MLVGKQIALRPFTFEEAQLIAEWEGNPEFGGFYIDPNPTTPEAVEARIREDWQARDRHSYLITNRATREPMGIAAYYRASHLPWVHGEEIGYTIHPSFRGRGVATQTACILVNHIFDSTPAHRVQATVTVGNDPSCRVLERAGMSREGVMRSAIYLHGRYRDLQLYSVTRAEWTDEERYRVGRAEF